jgi:glycosyltransferase involved in cell wall biosynthesis
LIGHQYTIARYSDYFMHILLIHQAFAAIDEPGGTRHHEIARYLTKRGHQVTIIASNISYLTGKSKQDGVPWVEKNETESGISILRAYTYPALHRSFVHRVFSFFSFMISSFFIGLKIKDVDLMWGTSPPIFQSLTAWALARIKRVPFLLEIRDLWPAFAIAIGVLRQPSLIRASEWLEGFLYRHADQVDGLRGKFIVLYSGAHGISNDLAVVLNAANILENQDDILFVLLGDGKEKPSLQSFAKGLGLTNLIFLPPIPKTEMPRALSAADVCIAILKPIPLYATVYPNKVFDYMAAGKPVILAIEGVIREVIEAADSGIPIPPGDPAALAESVIYLADHPQERIEMGLKGRDYVKEHFDRPIQARKFGQIMEKMVNPSKV